MPARDTPESRVLDEKQSIAISKLFVDSQFRHCVRCVSHCRLWLYGVASMPFTLYTGAAAGPSRNLIKDVTAGEDAAFDDGTAEKPM